MTFTQKLTEALKVVPLAKLDKRLATNSDFTPIQADTQKSKQSTSNTGPSTLPPPVHSNLRRERLPLSDSTLREEGPTAMGALDTDLAQMPEDENAITDQDLAQVQGQGQSQGAQEAGMPSGSGYTLETAKGQLDGIIKNWMDIAGNYPEGEQRHAFMELGERLRGVSAVLNRDFMNQDTQGSNVEGAAPLDTQPTAPPMEGPPLA